MKLYHISSIPNIKILKPQTSTHGKPYVYATSNLELGLLFGSHKSYGDFDGIYGTHNGKPFFYEAYANAFQRRFENETCYIYEVDPTTFESGKTSFQAEAVSEKAVKVLNCTKIDDLYCFLNNLIQENKIEFWQYDPSNLDYIEMINQHIIDRILRYKILQKKNTSSYKFCKEKFPNIIKELESEQRKE